VTILTINNSARALWRINSMGISFPEITNHKYQINYNDQNSKSQTREPLAETTPIDR
jgi:hypothetical protein